jgi:hypothetical protein
MSGDHKLSIRVEAFTPRVSNTLRGFVTVVVPELHMKINDITVHQKNESRWIGLPGKPQIGRDGQVRKDERGKTLYTPVLEFIDSKTRDAFSHRVVEELLAHTPAAFETEAAA